MEPTRIVFEASPDDGTAGSALAPAITVALRDDQGNTITSATETVTVQLANHAAGAILSGTLIVDAIDGVATFDDLVIDKAATGYTLRATAGGLPEATSAAFDVAPGPASRLLFQTPPSDVDLDLPFASTVTVVAVDDLGNVAAEVVDVTLAIDHNPGQALLDGTTTITTANGIATFTDVRVDRVAIGYTLIAEATGLVAVTSAPFDVRFAFQQLSGSVDVQFAQDHTCGVTTGGAAYCWGSNVFGQLGNGVTGTDSDTPVRVLGDRVFASVAAGFGHTCGITTGGDAYCWGLNVAGALGDGHTGNDSDVPVPVQGDHAFAMVVTGIGYTCGLSTAGDAMCWGANDVGQLGNGNVGVSSPVPVPVLGGHSFVSLTGGGQHTCGLTSAGSVQCWGGNGYGQLGNGNTGTESDVPVLVQGTHTYVTLAAGAYHTCGVTNDADAYCWGFNTSGQLGNGAAGTDSDTPVLVQGGHRFASVTGGTLHTCGMTTNGSALCWGDNSAGELGHGGSETESDIPVSVQGGYAFTSLASGSFHACGIAVDQKAYCWGWNEWGQLGDGSVGNDQSTPVIVANP